MDAGWGGDWGVAVCGRVFPGVVVRLVAVLRNDILLRFARECFDEIVVERSKDSVRLHPSTTRKSLGRQRHPTATPESPARTPQ